MRLIRSLVPAALVVGTILIASKPGRANDAVASAEVRRIRIHFDSVLTALTTRDVHTLSSEQLARRRALTTTLRAYRARGVFPHNYDFPGQSIPYFVDRKTGTRCAVAHLLESTARADIVARVARANNNVWVAQLARDSAFTNWLDANGITLDEAAFIQLPYSAPVSKAEVARQAGFAITAPIALGTAMVTSAVNLFGNSDGHRTTASKVGIVSGLTTMVMGSAVMAKTDLTGIGASSVAIGLTSVALSMRSIRNHSIVVAEREAERARSASQTSVAPIISTSNGGSAGLAVSLRF